jgi:hypothetical protein
MRSHNASGNTAAINRRRYRAEPNGSTLSSHRVLLRALTLPDGRVILGNRKPGEPLWFEGADRIPKHAVENLSGKAFEGLRIEIKPRSVGPTKPE